ncbi:hypothetical protein [uncultured Lamprocystis sp.]|jgi:hypothetical protein|uniref:hypothetical protein n=1 Tax=uncultured Lamprocystis sp. TaxID=543132 RepID=UPI0025DBE615|nr:hypothetical protein [uncultured Lamprocystis sp.]
MAADRLRREIESLLRGDWRHALGPSAARQPVLGSRGVAVPMARASVPVPVSSLLIETGWVTLGAAMIEPGTLWYPPSVAARAAGPSPDAIMDLLVRAAGGWDFDVTAHTDGRDSLTFPGDGVRAEWVGHLWDGANVTGRLKAMQQALLGERGRGFGALASYAFSAPSLVTQTYGIFHRPDRAGWYWMEITRDGVRYQPMVFTPLGDAIEASRIAADPTQARQLEAYLWTQAAAPSGAAWSDATGEWPAGGVLGSPLRGGWQVSDDGDVAAVATQADEYAAGATTAMQSRGRDYRIAIAEASGGGLTAHCTLHSSGRWCPSRAYESIWIPFRGAGGLLAMVPVEWPVWEPGGVWDTSVPVYTSVLPDGSIAAWTSGYQQHEAQSLPSSDFNEKLAATSFCGVGGCAVDWQTWTALGVRGFAGPTDLRVLVGSGGTRRCSSLTAVVTLPNAKTWVSSNQDTQRPRPGRVGGLGGAYALGNFCDNLVDARPSCPPGGSDGTCWCGYYGANYYLVCDFGRVDYRTETLSASSQHGYSALILAHGDPGVTYGYKAQTTPGWGGAYATASGGGILTMDVWWADWCLAGRAQYQYTAQARIPQNSDWTGEFAPRGALVQHNPDQQPHALARSATGSGSVSYPVVQTVTESRVVGDVSVVLSSAVSTPAWSGETAPYVLPLDGQSTELTLVECHLSAIERLAVQSAGCVGGWARGSTDLPAGTSSWVGAWIGGV